jgi:tetratricopeptide (TPR) repeat protein
MKSDTGAAEAWFALGNLLARQERIPEAAMAFQSALDRAPTHALARASLGNCQLMTWRLDEAIANYEVVLRARPGDAAVQRNLELAREMKRGGRR